MGTQKNRIDETALLSTKDWWVRKYLQFNAQCVLSLPMFYVQEKIALCKKLYMTVDLIWRYLQQKQKSPKLKIAI